MDNASTTLDKGMWIIDRFEEDFAVLENAETLETVSLPRAALPSGAAPGDTLVMADGAWRIDSAETEARKQRIGTMFERIKARNRGR